LKEPLDQDCLKSASRPLSSESARRIQRLSEEQIPSKTADALGEITQDPLEEGHDEDSFYKTTGHTSPTLSSLPRVKIPKHPSNAQEGDPEGLNSDTFYKSGDNQVSEQIPSVQAVPKQEQIPEGIDTAVFSSSRIARMLGGETHRTGRGDLKLKLKGVKDTPVEKTGLADGKDQDTFNVRTSSQESPSRPDVASPPDPAASSADAKEDIEKLAQELAQESSHSAKVRHLI
jgi:aarF domain-containing kinase